MIRYTPMFVWLPFALGVPMAAEAASVSASVTGVNGQVSVDIEATEGATASGSASVTIDGETTTVEHSCTGPCSFHERVEAMRAQSAARMQAFRDRVAAERAAREAARDSKP